MSAKEAPAKVNLALVVGPLRDDGKHEIVSLMAPLELADRIELDSAKELDVTGFDEDTLVRGGARGARDGSGHREPLAGGDRQGDPGGGGPRRRKLGRSRRSAARERDARRAAARCALARARGHARRRHSVLPRAAGRSSPAGTALCSSRSSSPRTSPSYSSSRTAPRRARPPPSTASSTRGAAIAASRRAWPRSSTRCAAVTWRASPRTTSRHRRTRRGWRSWEHSAPTSPAPGLTVYGLFRDGDAAAQAARAVERLGRVWVDKPGW